MDTDRGLPVSQNDMQEILNEMLCCIGMTSFRSDKSYQLSCPLVHQRRSTYSNEIGTERVEISTQYNSRASFISVSLLEDAVRARVEYPDLNDEFDSDPIQIFESDDAILLHCRATNPVSSSGGSVGGEMQTFGFFDKDSPVRASLIEPCNEFTFKSKSHDDCCCCQHPRGTWHREKRKVNLCSMTLSIERELKIIDLTKIQNLRRLTQDVEFYPCFDTPGKVFHLLRSILKCPSGLHCASPWYLPSSQTSYCTGDKAVALLVKSPSFSSDASSNDFWDELEERELSELTKFRTGDAAPSYFLYSVTQLANGPRAKYPVCSNRDGMLDDLQLSELFQSSSMSDTVLLVFRHLPPRDVLTIDEPKHTDCRCSPQTMTSMFYPGCLWERIVDVISEIESDDLERPKQMVIKHRMVSPPYLSLEQEYPGLLDPILNNLKLIREEVARIPQWTAWPERNHYSSCTDDENTLYAAWTVFPLCHTFPADDVRHRKFIEKTCSFVPLTTSLLKDIGSSLRTALFSRLDKRTTLGTHTGWSDLANHVLRLHIPLVVPTGKLCGTWVDGW